jgi:hypothetical protein
VKSNQIITPATVALLRECAGMPSFLESAVTPLLSYTTPKRLKIDIGPLGLLHWALVAGVGIFALYGSVWSDSWAHAETPLGTVNAYHSIAYDGRQEYVDVTQAPITTLPYCSTIFAAEASWSDQLVNFDNPECVVIDDREIVQKGPNSLAFTTIYQEQNILGWPCALPATDATVISKRGMRCGVRTSSVGCRRSTTPRVCPSVNSDVRRERATDVRTERDGAMQLQLHACAVSCRRRGAVRRI